MKIFKRFASVIAAAAIMLTCFVQVSAITNIGGTQYRDGFYDFAAGTIIPTGTYYFGDGASSFQIHEYASGAHIRINAAHTAHGARSLRLWSYGDESGQVSDEVGRVRITFKFAQRSSTGKYLVSFNAYNDNSWNWRDYATMGMEEWNGKARFKNSETLWTKTELGVASDIGGVGSDTWYHYEHTFSSNSDTPQLDFSANGWSVIIMDDIVVRDEAGNVLFSENFEQDEPENVTYSEGEQTVETYYDGWRKEGDTKRLIQVEKDDVGDNHRLRIYGRNGDTGSGNVGTYKIALPKTAPDGEYHITYDAEIPSGSGHTSASLDVSGNAIYGAGRLNNSGGDHVVTGNGKFLYFAAEGWANAWVDNIVVKDSSGNTLFTEDFENFDTKYTYKAYSSKLQGLSANGIDDTIYLSWRNPQRDDITAIKIFENGEETIESQISDILIGSEQVNIVEMSDNFSGAGTAHEYDVRIFTDSNLFYHNYITAKEGERFLSAAETKDGKALRGWRLSGRDGNTYKGLGSVYYDTLNKASGTTSLHINPNITRISTDQPFDSDATHVTVQYGSGEEQDSGYHLFLDAYACGLEDGQTYKLKLKQKGHHSPVYHIYSEGFKIGDGTSTTIGALSTYNERNYDSAWRDVEYEFTVNGISSSSPVIRFDFSNGCDDFWIDDVELTKAGSNVNLLENGSFEPISSYIYDAELYEVEQIENEYVITGTPDNLTGNTLIKSNVKIENISETDPVSADVYTALYKDGRLIRVDKVTLSAAQGGTTSGGSVISIPAVNDGEYSVKVFVWKSGEMKPLKNVTTLSE